MTVRGLLAHFSIYPNRIAFHDIDKNDTGTIDIMSSSHSVNAYNNFLSKYGNRKVKDWQWAVNDSIYIQFAKEEDE